MKNVVRRPAMPASSCFIGHRFDDQQEALQSKNQAKPPLQSKLERPISSSSVLNFCCTALQTEPAVNSAVVCDSAVNCASNDLCLSGTVKGHDSALFLTVAPCQGCCNQVSCVGLAIGHFFNSKLLQVASLQSTSYQSFGRM